MMSKKRLAAVVTAMFMTTTVFAPGVFAAEKEGGAAGLSADNPSAAAPTEVTTEATQEIDSTAPSAPSTTPTDESEQTDPTQPGKTDGEAETSYHITINAGAHGTVTTNSETAKPGETVTYTVTPEAGYKIASITIGDKKVSVKDPYQAVSGDFLPEGDVVIAAQFAKLASYKITTSVTPKAGGKITATASVKENSSKKITATASKGYYLADLQVDGKSVGAKTSYTFSQVRAKHTVKAVFKKQIKIMLDAGHYGKYNRSPVYKAYYESDMTWKLHNYLKAALAEYEGFAVSVTRSSQKKDMNVYYRGTAAKGCDLFLSLHSNYCSSSSTDYPLVITQKGKTGDKLAKNLGKIIQQTMGTKQSYRTMQRLNSDKKTEYYGVLRGSKAVGVKGMILEHSFHSNLKMTKWLYKSSNLKKLAEAEAKTLADYYGLAKKDGKKASTTTGSAAAATDSSSSSTSSTAAKTTTSTTKTVKSSQKVKVLVSDLNMRKSYSASSKSMGKAKKNKTYQLKAKTKDGKWGQLKTNGYWIYLKGYTKVVTSSGSSASKSTSASSKAKSTAKTVSCSQKVKVLVSDLNMRKSYSTSSKSMGKAKKNKTYQLKAKTKDGKWGQIKSNNYWIYLPKYTKIVSSSKAGSTAKAKATTTASKTVKSSQKVKVTVSDLNMRKSYSTSSKSMGKVKKNKTYQLKAKTKDGKWGQLKTNGYWIYLKGYTKAA